MKPTEAYRHARDWLREDSHELYSPPLVARVLDTLKRHLRLLMLPRPLAWARRPLPRTFDDGRDCVLDLRERACIRAIADLAWESFSTADRELVERLDADHVPPSPR